MKFVSLVPLAALSSAIVIPDEATLNELAAQTESHNSLALPEHPLDDLRDSVDDLIEDARDDFESVEFGLRDSYHDAKNALDDAFGRITDAEDAIFDKIHETGFDKPNQTVYELISKSKYTTKLAKLINDDPELVKVLNGTAANYTVFAPTDKAFEKIPKHGKEPSEEFIKKLLLYHVSPDFYPAGRVLKTHTIPTLYKEPALGEDFAQRLSVNVGLRGLTLDFYSRIIAINIFGTNGVIHGIDTILIPPPKAVDIISLLPGEFSTLTLGLDKTGLLDALNTTNRAGGTFFAPSNWAFKKLGPRINAFLFSSYGEKYLTALLKYHVVPEQTLYSDAFYRPSKDDEERSSSFHVDLATLLDDKALSIDVGSFGPFTQIKINGFTTVAVQNGIAKDGVIQIVSSVLIPPKTAEAQDFWRGEPMSVEEFKERLAPFVESDDTEADDTELGWGEL
ncbi:putative fasciclin domain family protein [Neofusicoccum parvum UCRNP2]|uniref:Putative fasciclin domain family protein n=1 Tax=Botryosphaeria parva (strain UCR-NP2) TaxID=1287680 RepID=R1EWZ5_BOTPV|nr:putative fasciclin domain family protein [Neofusicoccum parvum UCRNP2]